MALVQVVRDCVDTANIVLNEPPLSRESTAATDALVSLWPKMDDSLTVVQLYDPAVNDVAQRLRLKMSIAVRRIRQSHAMGHSERSMSFENQAIDEFVAGNKMYLELLMVARRSLGIDEPNNDESPTPIEGAGPTLPTAHVDHCHETGKVRALLCRGCNHGIGNFCDEPDWLIKAAAYVLTHRNDNDPPHLREVTS